MTRSASPSACPQVGSAGQAMARRCSGRSSSASGTPWRAQDRLDLGPSASSMPHEQHVLAGGEAHLGPEALRRSSRRAERSWTVVGVANPARVDVHAEEPAPSVLAVPAEVLVAVGPIGQLGASASSEPSRDATSARNQSSPRSSMVYFSRARWRSSRLPKSRWMVTMASTASPSRSAGTQAMGEASRG